VAGVMPQQHKVSDVCRRYIKSN